MYAVIKVGGKQHKVQQGDVIEVELVHGGHDGAISFTPLLVVDDDGKTHYGKDLGKAQVKGKLVGQEKGDKVKIFKYRPKTGYTRRQGHRQMYTLVEIQEVVLGKRAPAKKAGEEEEPEVAAVPAPKRGKGGQAASAGTAVAKPARTEESSSPPEEAVEGASMEPEGAEPQE
jgi:large subunit ribosomal protein L21